MRVLGTWGYICNNGAGCGAIATRESLSFEDAYQHVDVVATVGYFDCARAGDSPNAALLSIPEVLQMCRDDLGNIRAGIRALAAIASEFGKPLQVYEGGPSLVQSSAISSGYSTPAMTQLLISVNRDPGFQSVYSEYLRMFEEEGLIISSSLPYMQFSSVGLPSKYGSWGLLEFTGQEAHTAPKYLALAEYVDSVSSAAPPQGCMTPELGYRGLGDASFVGFPAVIAPRQGDVWEAGKAYSILWSVEGAPTSRLVSIRLWRGTNCGPGASLIATVGTGIPATGNVAYELPRTAHGGSDFFFEIEAPGSRNFSRCVLLNRADSVDGKQSYDLRVLLTVASLHRVCTPEHHD